MFDELEALLISVALGEVPNRQSASAYSDLRVDLLRSCDPRVIPGFLAQCMSIYKYREFINLYDGRAAERQRFVADAFDRMNVHVRGRATGKGEMPADYVSRVF